MAEPIFSITSYDSKANKIRARLHPSARDQRGPWLWPLSRVGSRDPIVLAEYVVDTRRGIELGYTRAPFDSDLHVPVRAAQSGEVSFAIEGEGGCAVSIDHGDFTTHYAHLSKIFVAPCLGKRRRRRYVRAGDVIGNAARSTLHVRFELWQWTDDRGFVAVDPVPHLKSWNLVPPDGGLRLLPSITNPDNEAA